MQVYSHPGWKASQIQKEAVWSEAVWLLFDDVKSSMRNRGSWEAGWNS